MNKMFKVVWNHATQKFVVASELAKANGKSSSSSDERSSVKAFALTAMAAAMWSLSGSAAAKDLIIDTTTATIADSSTATSSIKVSDAGSNKNAVNEDSIAIGNNITMNRTGIVLGRDIVATQGTEDPGIGNSLVFGDNVTLLNHEEDLAVGFNISVDSSGMTTKASVNDARNTIAIGRDINVDQSNSITSIGRIVTATGVADSFIGGNKINATDTINTFAGAFEANLTNVSTSGVAISRTNLNWVDKSFVGTSSSNVTDAFDSTVVGSTNQVANIRNTHIIGSNIDLKGSHEGLFNNEVIYQKPQKNKFDANQDGKYTAAETKAYNDAVKEWRANYESKKLAEGTTENFRLIDGAVILGDRSSLYGTGSVNDPATGRAAVDVKQATVGKITYGEGVTEAFAGRGVADKVVSVGAAGNERQIKNVAAGVISSVSTDAVNGSQLYAALNALNNTASTVASHLGGGSQVQPNGTLSAPNYTLSVTDQKTPASTTANNVGGGLTNLNQYVNEGFKVADGDTNVSIRPRGVVNFVNGTATEAVVTTNGDNQANVTFNVKTDGTTIKVENGNLTAVTGGLTAQPNGTVSAPNGTSLVNASTVANAINNASFNVTIANTSAQIENGAALPTEVKAGSTVTYTAGKNLAVKKEGTNITYGLAKDVDLSEGNTTLGNTTLAEGATLNLTEGNTILGNTTLAEGATLNLTEGNTILGNTTLAEGETLNLTEGNTILGDTTFEGNVTFGPNSTVNFGGNTTLSNISSNLAPTYNAGDLTVGKDGNLTDTAAAEPTKSQAHPENVKDIYNNAASVGDVLNSGWNLQGNGEAKDFVKAYDTVNFVNGTGTVANVTAAENGKSSTVAFDVKTDGTTIKVDGDSGNLTAVTGGLTAQPNGTVSAPNGTSLVNASTVADAINNASFKVTVANNDEQVVAGGESAEVKAGSTVTYAAGKNLVVNQTGTTITYGLADNLSVGGAGKNGKDGVDGTFGVNGKDGVSGVALNGKDGTIGLTGPKGEDGVSPKAVIGVTQKGDAGLKGNDGANGESKTRIVYTKPNGEQEQIATLNDGLKFAGNNNDTVNNHTLNTQVNIVGEGVSKEDSESFKSAAGNINVKADGKETLTVQLNKDVNLTEEGSLTAGDTVVNNDGITINNGTTEGKPVSITKDGLNNGGNKITNVAAGTGDTDGVNVKQLEDAIKSVQNTDNGGGFGLSDDSGDEVKQNIGKVIPVKGADGITTNVTIDDEGNKALEIGLGDNVDIGSNVTVGAKGADGKDGKDGMIAVNGKDGSAVVINGKDGSVGATGKDGKTGVTLNGNDGSIGINGKDGTSSNITVAQGPAGVNGKDGETLTRIVYGKPNPANPAETVPVNVATLEDGLKFVGDDGKVIAKPLNTQLDIVGGAKGKLTENNIGVVNKDGKLSVQLAKDVDLGSDGSLKAGDTVVNNDGITINNGTNGKPVSITKDGLDNGGNPIRNVGESTDPNAAATVNQVNQSAAGLNNRIDGVENHANAGVAQAMATAGLVQAYLPGKSLLAVGGGVYRGESGYAIGYSTISDGGNWIVKGTASGNSRGSFGATASVGYQW